MNADPHLLAEKAFEGTLTPDEEQQLILMYQHNPDILKELRMTLALAALVQAREPDPSRNQALLFALRHAQTKSSSSQRSATIASTFKRIHARRRQPLALVAGIAAALVIGVIVVLHGPGDSNSPPEIRAPIYPTMQASLFVDNRLDPASDVQHPLEPGDTLVAGPHGTELRYQDGSMVALSPGSRLRLGTGPGIDSELISGSIQVVISPGQRPVAFTTAQGRATVKGTRFSLKSDASASRLLVNEGSVRWQASAAPIDVSANEQLHSKEGQLSSIRRLETIGDYRLYADVADRYRHNHWYADSWQAAGHQWPLPTPVMTSTTDLDVTVSPTGLTLRSRPDAEWPWGRMALPSPAPTAYQLSWRISLGKRTGGKVFRFGFEHQVLPDLRPPPQPLQGIGQGSHEIVFRFVQVGLTKGDRALVEITGWHEDRLALGTWTEGYPTAVTVDVGNEITLSDMRYGELTED